MSYDIPLALMGTGAALLIYAGTVLGPQQRAADLERIKIEAAQFNPENIGVYYDAARGIVASVAGNMAVSVFFDCDYRKDDGTVIRKEESTRLSPNEYSKTVADSRRSIHRERKMDLISCTLNHWEDPRKVTLY